MNLENMIKLGSLQQSVNQLISTRKKHKKTYSAPYHCLNPCRPWMQARHLSLKSLGEWFRNGERSISSNEASSVKQREGCLEHVALQFSIIIFWDNIIKIKFAKRYSQRTYLTRLNKNILPIPQTVITLILTTHSTPKTQIPSGPEMLKHKTGQKLEKRFWWS